MVDEELCLYKYYICSSPAHPPLHFNISQWLTLTMASAGKQPHFLFVPLMSPGDMIPLMDMAQLFAKRGVISTVITTTHNAGRFEPVFDRCMRSGLPIRLIKIDFPSQAAGVPEGIDNFDSIHSPDLGMKFFPAIELLQKPIEKFLEEEDLQPRPSCMISDYHLPWTYDIACKLKVPRIVFHGRCSFSLLCARILHHQKPHEDVASEFESFVLPGLPDRIEISRSQLQGDMINRGNTLILQELMDRNREFESKSYGVVINSFKEMEPEYVDIYKKALGKKVWTIGPVSLCNKEMIDKAERGNRAAIDVKKCLDWLDSKRPGSVLYACFGSLNRFTTMQLREIGLGLEASNHPFVFVIRKGERVDEVESWLAGGFMARAEEKGLIINGWAPQALILSHRAIGGFLTHCGWNSTLEGICAGVPMLTWPLFAEQFINEKLVVNVLKVGISVGVRESTKWYQEEENKLVRMEEVKKAVEILMGDNSEVEEMRSRARELAKSARETMEEGGSSYEDMTLLIDDITEKATKEAEVEVL